MSGGDGIEWSIFIRHRPSRPLLGRGPNHKRTRVDGHAFRAVVRLVDANQSVCKFKHVVAQRNNDKLRPLRLFHDVVRHNRHVFEVCEKGKMLRSCQTVSERCPSAGFHRGWLSGASALASGLQCRDIPSAASISSIKYRGVGL